jgi:transposase InsO family protein
MDLSEYFSKKAYNFFSPANSRLSSRSVGSFSSAAFTSKYRPRDFIECCSENSHAPACSLVSGPLVVTSPVVSPRSCPRQSFPKVLPSPSGPKGRTLTQDVRRGRNWMRKSPSGGHYCPRICILTIVRPETLVRWHRAGFRRFWRWKSNSRGGRPRTEIELRALIRQMSRDIQLWGAPRIHGELLKLGFSVAQSTVAKYMVKRRGPPSQGWRIFLRNHAPDIAAMDLFVVPTIGFKLLYGFVIVRIDRRELIWINVTTNPTAEWIARQIIEAFPWDGAPGYMIRDRDRIYGAVVIRRLRAMGIRDKPIAPASLWQNGFAERLIGSIRSECLDHVVIWGEAHLRRVLKSYAYYYNNVRTHRSLNEDAPVSRPVQLIGVINSRSILGGLHHQYARV